MAAPPPPDSPQDFCFYAICGIHSDIGEWEEAFCLEYPDCDGFGHVANGYLQDVVCEDCWEKDGRPCYIQFVMSDGNTYSCTFGACTRGLILSHSPSNKMYIWYKG